MSSKVVTINIKHDMPTVEEARRRLVQRLTRLAGEGVAVVKVIHGYGSTGKGGGIRRAVFTTLRRLQAEGLIRGWVPGEQWKKSSEIARELLKTFPYLADEADLEKGNQGCTIVAIARKKKSRAAEQPLNVRPPEDVDTMMESDPGKVYDMYSRPDFIRRMKPES
jgi:hypothetical protein